jgi:hypothetical protein
MDSFLTESYVVVQMSLTVSQIYGVRFGAKLPLPKSVQDNIAKLRIMPVVYKPFRPAKHATFRPKQEVQNWREKALATYVSKIRDKDDKDYHEVFAILNKLSLQNIQKLSEQAITIISKRDEEFRLRITTLVFNKAITESMYAGILGDFALILQKEFSEVSEDLSTQAKMFTKLYDNNVTLTYPQASEVDFDNKVILWMKQKQTRRGYAKFLTQLFVRNLINEDIMLTSLQDVTQELLVIAKQQKTEQAEENVTQYVDFLFESSKVLPATSIVLKQLIQKAIQEILDIPRPDLPSLSMRSRFRLEDVLKCVQYTK